MKYVPYYRVSAASQGKSGLGLAAQRQIVHHFIKAHDELLLEFVEVESGKRADRPQRRPPLPSPNTREPGF